MDDLSDFLKIIAEEKKKKEDSSVGLKFLKKLEKDLYDTNPFIITPRKQKTEPTADLSNEAAQVVGEFIFEDGKFTHSSELNEVVVPQIKPASQIHSQGEIDKLLKQNASFQQPNPDKVDPNIQAIQNKLKFMEQSIGKIAATGPGSGEVQFRWLDDVDRSTIDVAAANQEHVLRYNSSTKKFFFGELTGDHREINSFTFDVDGPGIDKTPRMVYWNQDEDCLQIEQADGTSCSIGLENYIQVRNSTGSTITNGTVVRFAGAYSNGDYVPEVIPHIADGTIPPLYTVGVITANLPSNSTGRATVLGKVRGVNTTGSDVSETWNEGDILYVHPTLAGKLTKNKPTAPQVVISVAAVLRKNSTDGILLVRPTIFPRLHYGTFVDKTNQTITEINVPKAVTFNTTEVANGHRRGTDTSHIIADVSGYYNYKFSIQLVSTNASSKDVYIWFRKNGFDILDSASRLTIVGNNVYSVAAWDVSVSMQPNDFFQIMWAATDAAVSIAAPAATAFCPAIPSVILNVTEVAL